MLRFARLVGGLLLFVAVVALGLVAYLRSSLPRIDGTQVVAGVSAPIELVRDADAVLHVYAASYADAVFGLGYAHAQDRLWQLEFQRRVGAGRLSEVIGETTLSTDRFLRTLGVRRAAEEAWSALQPATQALIESYVAGVNASLANRTGALPPEFLLLGFEPEPFEPVDVLTWAKMMAWDLGDNWDTELARAAVIAALEPVDPAALVTTLWPSTDDDATVVIPERAAELYRQLDLSALADLAGDPKPDGYGSNNWVLAGSQTLGGAPILANDPHLGLQAPSLWYFAHLVAPGLDVIGATLPGTPVVLLGRTDRHAWGFTNTAADVQDLFVERVDPTDPDRYLTPGGSAAFTTRREVIRVKGAADVEIEIRETRHGPVISDAHAGAARAAAQYGESAPREGASVVELEGAASADTADGGAEDVVLALRWTALFPGDRTVEAVLGMNTARSHEAFVDALRSFRAPMQNIVYADVDGVIAYHAPGLIPIRRSGNGSVPMPGWTGEGDWIAYVPFADLPHLVDPLDGRIVTANQRVVPDAYPYYLTRDWTVPYRAERIHELLDDQVAATPEGSVRIQLDQFSPMAREFVALARSATPGSEGARRIQALLLDWDGEMHEDDAAPLAFAAWYRHLAAGLYRDDLGDAFDAFFGLRPQLTRAILAGDPDWCDDTTTPAPERCEDVAAVALDAAWTELSARFGEDESRWRWGDAHQAVFDHDLLSGTPLRLISDLRIGNGGDGFSLDAAGYPAMPGASFDQTAGPGYRAVYDLAAGGTGEFVHGTGQSGNPLSLRYRDYLRRWSDGRMIPMRMERSEVTRDAIGVLRLEPGPL